MLCRAELPVAELAGALLVPRHAVYDNRWVYVFEPDPDAVDGRQGRLGQREVPVLRSLGDAVLVDYAGREGTEVCELKPGEQVVVSPLPKPVVGMQVRLRDEQIASSEAVTLVWPQHDRRQPTRISGALPHQLGLIRGGG